LANEGAGGGGVGDRARDAGRCDWTHLAVDEGEDVEEQAADGADDGLDGGLDDVDAGAEQASVVLGEAVERREAHRGLRLLPPPSPPGTSASRPSSLLLVLHHHLPLLLWTARPQIRVIRPKPSPLNPRRKKSAHEIQDRTEARG
jgi:hypothetical protein